MAHQLRWIHSPSPRLNRLCLEDIEKLGNILVTSTKEENIPQIGEYAMSCILAFAKNLFHWRDADKYPKIIWDSKWRDQMWTLKDRLLLQVGLGKIGTEIARRARQMDMRVWGAQINKTFHPYCNKTFSMRELYYLLPQADVVSISLPRGAEFENWLKQYDLELMKDGCILMIIGSHTVVNEEALAELAQKEKFRGIIIDAFYQTPIPPASKLWTLPNAIITPEVSPRPKSEEKMAFRNFRYNLRQYLHGNFSDMRNIIDIKAGSLW